MQDTPCVVTEDYSSLEEGYEYDVGNQRHHINMEEQEVFSDQEDSYQEPAYYNNQPYGQWRKPTEDERETLTIAAIAQAKNTYNLRNRTTNVEQGTPESVFIKD